MHVLLRREGWDINIKKTHRIYNELGLQLRNKTPERRVKAKLREDRAPATRPNDVGAMDFVHGSSPRVSFACSRWWTTFSRFSPSSIRASARAENVCESACKRLPSFSVIGFQTGTTSGSFNVVGL